MTAQSTTWTAIAVLTGSVAVAAAQSASPDYPRWRGRNRDGANRVFINDVSTLARRTLN